MAEGYQNLPVNTFNVNYTELSPDSPYSKNIGGYSSGILLGFAQGIGPVSVLLSINGNNIVAKNLVNGSDFSSNYVTITCSNGIITISTTASGVSRLVFIFSGSNL